MLGALEKAFAFEANMETEVESDDEFSDLPSSELAMKLYGTTKARIRSQWVNALIAKKLGTEFQAFIGQPIISSSMDCLLELPIEYYDHSVLKEIGEAIGPILRIGTHTAAESKGCFARLCVQVNLDKPIVETCYYMIKTSLAEDRNGEDSKIQGTEECTVQDIEGEPWVLVTRKRQQFKRVLKDQARPSNLGSLAHNPIK
nr:hypothetical protein CFP56_24784 [Quercus suber]